MEQYIPKSALVAEIEKLFEKAGNSLGEYRNGAEHTLISLKDSIDTLEVKEVDLDREIRRYRMRNPIIQHREESLYDYMANVAKHFFELGMAVSNKQIKEKDV